MDDQGTNRESGSGIAPRYSLRRYWAAFTLVAMGIASAVIGCNLFTSRDSVMLGFRPLPASVAACWLVAGVLLGTGIFTPFRRELWGAFWGFFLAAAWTFMAFVATHWDAWMSV